MCTSTAQNLLMNPLLLFNGDHGVDDDHEEEVEEEEEEQGDNDRD